MTQPDAACDAAVQQWVEDCCAVVRKPQAASMADLFASWEAWAKGADVEVGTRRELSRRLLWHQVPQRNLLQTGLALKPGLHS